MQVIREQGAGVSTKSETLWWKPVEKRRTYHDHTRNHHDLPRGFRTGKKRIKEPIWRALL